MSDVFKVDALELVDRSEARGQVTDDVAGTAIGQALWLSLLTAWA